MKQFNRSDRKTSRKQWIYVDENRQQWKGRVCATCTSRRKAKRVAELAGYVYKAAVAREDELVGPAVPEFEGRKRPCSSCGLMTVNRYNCQTCNGADVSENSVRGQLMQACDAWGVTV